MNFSVRIREGLPKDSRAIARIHVDTWKTTYRQLIPDALLDALRYDERERSWHEVLSRSNARSAVFVADDGSEPVGFAACGPARDQHESYDAELYAIYVLKAYQGFGIGKRLFEACAGRITQAGYSGIRLWVLEENPARKFYEAVGGTLFARKEEQFGEALLNEVGYGWALSLRR